MENSRKCKLAFEEGTAKTDTPPGKDRWRNPRCIGLSWPQAPNPPFGGLRHLLSLRCRSNQEGIMKLKHFQNPSEKILIRAKLKEPGRKNMP